MKKIFLVIIILAVIVPGAFAQFRLDLAIDVPVQLGISVSDFEGDISDDSINVLDLGTFPFPEVLFAYQSSIGPLKIGAGVRGYSIILESVLWPHLYTELELSNFVLNAGIGGGAFMLFGLMNSVDTFGLFFPTLSATYKLGKTFQLGVGAMGFMGNDLNTDIFPYVIYLTGKFSILFNENN